MGQHMAWHQNKHVTLKIVPKTFPSLEVEPDLEIYACPWSGTSIHSLFFLVFAKGLRLDNQPATTSELLHISTCGTVVLTPVFEVIVITENKGSGVYGANRNPYM